MPVHKEPVIIHLVLSRTIQPIVSRYKNLLQTTHVYVVQPYKDGSAKSLHLVSILLCTGSLQTNTIFSLSRVARALSRSIQSSPRCRSRILELPPHYFIRTCVSKFSPLFSALKMSCRRFIVENLPLETRASLKNLPLPKRKMKTVISFERARSGTCSTSRTTSYQQCAEFTS